jgi:hypothetical protein
MDQKYRVRSVQKISPALFTVQFGIGKTDGGRRLNTLLTDSGIKELPADTRMNFSGYGLNSVLTHPSRSQFNPADLSV